MDSSFAKITPLVIPFQNFVWQTRHRAKISGQFYYLLTIPCTLSRMQDFTCLIKSYKTNMFRLFQWNTVRRRIYYLCFVVHLFFKDSSCFYSVASKSYIVHLKYSPRVQWLLLPSMLYKIATHDLCCFCIA
jgi:hypothetical protein